MGCSRKHHNISCGIRTWDLLFSVVCCSLFLKKKIHLKACKNFLGINSCATNSAVVGETGRYPFMFDIVVNMSKYYKRLCTSDDILLKLHSL